MKTDDLITTLAAQAKPVHYLPPLRICMEWLAVLVLSVGGITLMHGLRADWAERVREPLFLLEIFFNTALMIRAGCAATLSSYPAHARIPVLNALLVTLFAGYSLIMLTQIFAAPATGLHSHPHGMECLLCILSYALIPAVWMGWRLRQLASTRPSLVGFAVLLLAMSAGCLGVRLVETETASAGLLLWHYLPLVVISALGLLLGRKIFNW